MVLILYHLDPSPPVRSVDLLIHTLGLKAQYKTVNLFHKDQLKPEFLKLNPLHTIPVIDDDGFILWESRAILTYLVSKYGKDDSLYPKDLQKRAIVDQRLHYSNDVFYIFIQIIKRILYSDATTILDEQLEKVKQTQENIEKLLEGQAFIAGDSLTVADFSYVTLVDILEVYRPTGDKFPLTKAWFQRCKSTIKDFDKINKKGADLLIEKLKEKLSK
ncbi:glutathione S-transferase D7-like [Macrosteles quadrilineatus]|uniref:glutathione S-transferase D7-like n=1 Tax=Macrosteles quadrilineatus TaxID=74068 RepID=UPI0023E2BB47|nr:glutathione S-transferase D7-like [Macrosteles quadrilineatus]XP_054285305.1 glutathione S-transferase D7-like [Macrosteles quadrilineatus]